MSPGPPSGDTDEEFLGFAGGHVVPLEAIPATGSGASVSKTAPGYCIVLLRVYRVCGQSFRFRYGICEAFGFFVCGGDSGCVVMTYGDSSTPA